MFEKGKCYKDPDDGEVVRVLGPQAADGDWSIEVLWPGTKAPPEDRTIGARRYRTLGPRWQRVPDPTPAVIDDEDAPVTEQEIADLEARVIDRWRTVKREHVEQLLALVKRQRSLPVLPTCGWCSEATDVHGSATFCAVAPTQHATTEISREAAPPDWCHLRKRTKPSFESTPA